MFPENRNFPNRQRRKNGNFEGMSQPFPKGDLLPFWVSGLVAAVVVVAVISILIFT